MYFTKVLSLAETSSKLYNAQFKERFKLLNYMWFNIV